jgi:hypothetical protein
MDQPKLCLNLGHTMQIFKQGKKIFDVNKRKCPFLTNFFSTTWSFSTAIFLIKIINGDYQIN